MTTIIKFLRAVSLPRSYHRGEAGGWLTGQGGDTGGGESRGQNAGKQACLLGERRRLLSSPADTNAKGRAHPCPSPT